MTKTTKREHIEILNALVARELVNNPHLSHLDMTFECFISYSPESDKPDYTAAKAAVKEEKRLAELGEKYFADGYRVKRTARYTQGCFFDSRVPDEALLFRRVSAGYLATCAQERIEYLIKRS